jgi:hypothetical protein
VALRKRIAEVEEDIEEAFRATRPLVKLLVQSITVGKKHEDGSIEVDITYRFGPPSPPPAEAGGEEVSIAGLKNGREFMILERLFDRAVGGWASRSMRRLAGGRWESG